MQAVLFKDLLAHRRGPEQTTAIVYEVVGGNDILLVSHNGEAGEETRVFTCDAAGEPVEELLVSPGRSHKKALKALGFDLRRLTTGI